LDTSVGARRTTAGAGGQMHESAFLFLCWLCGAMRAMGFDLATGELPNAPVLVVPLRELGLANRFRVLASAVQLAELLDRELHVAWFPSPGCNATFQDLFGRAKPAWPFVLYRGTSHVEPGGLPQLVVHDSGLQGGHRVRIVQHTGNIVSELQLRELRADAAAAADSVVFEVTAFFKGAQVSCQEYSIRKRAFYRQIAAHAAPPIPEHLAHALSQLQGLVIGMHARVDDPAYDWPVIPPQRRALEAQDSLSKLSWAEVSPPSLYLAAARSILRRHPRARFLVLSNSNSVRRALVEAIGAAALDVGAVVRPMERSTNCADSDEPGGGRACPSGVRRALLEWLLLGETSLLLHPFRSSYGEEASFLHLAPSVQIRDGGNVLGGDLSSDNCQQHVFAEQERADAAASERFCNDSDVCTPIVKLLACERFTEAWGVPNVYCFK